MTALTFGDSYSEPEPAHNYNPRDVRDALEAVFKLGLIESSLQQYDNRASQHRGDPGQLELLLANVKCYSDNIDSVGRTIPEAEAYTTLVRRHADALLEKIVLSREAALENKERSDRLGM